MEMRSSLSLLLILILASASHSQAKARRSGYRLPQPAGRSAQSEDVGSGRDMFKKFMLLRGLFQQPSTNVVVIQPPTTTTTTTPITTPSSSSIMSVSRGMSRNKQLEQAAALEEQDLDQDQLITTPELLDLTAQRQQQQRRSQQRTQSLSQSPSPQRNRRRRHKRRYANGRSKLQKLPSTSPSQSFIESYHIANDSNQRTPNVVAESQLQRLWRSLGRRGDAAAA